MNIKQNYLQVRVLVACLPIKLSLHYAINSIMKINNEILFINFKVLMRTQ